MNFKQIYNELTEYMNDTSHFTDEEIKLLMERCEDELELGIYKQVMIEHAAKIILKSLKKKAITVGQ